MARPNVGRANRAWMDRAATRTANAGLNRCTAHQTTASTIATPKLCVESTRWMGKRLAASSFAAHTTDGVAQRRFIAKTLSLRLGKLPARKAMVLVRSSPLRHVELDQALRNVAALHITKVGILGSVSVTQSHRGRLTLAVSHTFCMPLHTFTPRPSR
jgi:hypothetical protein